MRDYQDTIQIISGIMGRYDEMMPGIFNEMNKYEKQMLLQHPRHVFSKKDCRSIMEQYEIPILTENRLEVISECLLLLYNWYKSKIIYSIEQEATEIDMEIDGERVKLFPYSGVYLDWEFYFLEYVGCFVSVIKERKETFLQKYILLGFVEYDKDHKLYGIEPFMLEAVDGMSIQGAFLQWQQDSASICYNIERNIKAAHWVMSNLYRIIDRINNEKEFKTTSVKRKVTSRTLVASDSDEYRLTKESKYKYELKKGMGSGSKKSPHVRRRHNRHYPIKDEYGNVIGEKVITIKEMKIHPEQENMVTVKILPDN